jgi:hypothetical protein
MIQMGRYVGADEGAPSSFLLKLCMSTPHLPAITLKHGIYRNWLGASSQSQILRLLTNAALSMIRFNPKLRGVAPTARSICASHRSTGQQQAL